MSSPKKNEAVQDAVVHVRGKSANNGAHGTGLAVAHQRLHDLRQGRSLFSIIYFLLFFC